MGPTRVRLYIWKRLDPLYSHYQLDKMAAKTVFTYLAIFCLLQYSAAEETTLQDAVQRAQQAITDMAGQFTSFFSSENVPQADTVVQQLQNQSHSLANKISDLVQQLHTQAQGHSGDLSALFESVAQKWNETAANLQAEHPDATQRVEEIRTQLSNGLNTVVEEANKLAQAVQPHAQELGEQLKQIARSALDTAIESANQLKEQVSSTSH